MKRLYPALGLVVALAVASLYAQTTAPASAPAPAPASPAPSITVPDWALPSSATHKQVPPPAGFQRPTVIFKQPLGLFEGQADVGGPLLPGSASFDVQKKTYTLSSASYNIWYFRDEFRFAWKKMSGDMSMAADVTFPVAEGFSDRKAVLIFRQDLDDNAKEIMTAVHGGGLIHLSVRPDKGGNLKETEHLKADPAAAGGPPIRLGIEKHGDAFTLWISLKGEPMHQSGAPAELKFDGPFYVGIGFCSHVPDKTDTAVLSKVVFENVAGKAR